MNWRRRASACLVGAVAAVVVLGAGGCLPEGGPGIGERVFAARGVESLVSGVGETRPLLFTRWMDGRNYAGQPARVRDLYHLPAAQPKAVRVQEDVEIPFQFDARGRLYLLYGWAADPDAAVNAEQEFPVLRQLRRVDLLAGVTTELGWVHRLWMSPATTHMVVHLPGNRWLSRTLDDRAREIVGSPLSRLQFAGEDACVLDLRRLTCILQESGEPLLVTDREVLAFAGLRAGTGVPELVITVPDEAARAAGRTEATQLWLVRLRDVPGQPRETFLAGGRELRSDDVASGESQVAVLEGEPEGPVRLRVLRFGAAAPTVREWTLPPSARVVETTGQLPWSPPSFRPGRGEVWVLGTDGQLAIARADGPLDLLRVAGGADDGEATLTAQVIWTADELIFENRNGATPQARREMFTSDARWWVYRRGDQIHLTDADDPGAPSRLQTQVTSVRGVADILGQGRLILWSSIGYADLVRVRSFDRDTLTPLGDLDEVRRLVVGRRGMLALTTGRPSRGGGDLSPGQMVMLTHDGISPGPLQVLADNVTQFALTTSCLDCDPLQPGSPLAYLVHGRVPWKYDGLWMAELP